MFSEKYSGISSYRFCALIPLLLLTVACSRQPQRPFEIIAVVPFEDLSANNGGLIGRGVATIATTLTEGDEKRRVAAAASLAEARQAGATEVLTGWYDLRDGSAHLRGTVRDAGSQKVLRTFDLSGSPRDYQKLGEAVARETGAPLHQWSATSPESFEAYLKGLAAPAPAEAVQLLNTSIAADPSFGAAQLARIQALLRAGDRAAALAALGPAASARFNPGDQARFDLLRAEAAGNVDARIKALKRLSGIETANTTAWRGLAEAQIAAHDYRGAAESLSQVLQLAPNDEDALNRRGYLWAFAGDLDKARGAMDEYQRRHPQSPNAVDSLGEILFYFRQYQDASVLFLKAHQMNPASLGGAEPYRAALSLYLAGKTQEADALVNPTFQEVQRSRDPNAGLARSLWLFITQRPTQWPRTAVGLTMEAFAALERGDRASAGNAVQQARAASPTAGEIAVLSAAAFLAQPSASPQEWAARADKAVPDPRQTSLRRELLGWALLFDRHPAEAASLWKPVLSQTPLLAPQYNDLRMLLTWALVQSGNIEDARKIMPQGWMPPPLLQPGLQAVLYKKLPEIRKQF